MKLVGLMPARNEDWVLGLSARAALMWVDELLVLDHASTDRTPEILREIYQEDHRLLWIHEPHPEWREMAHRQRLLECARLRGATHIAMVDADEVLTGNLLPLIRIFFEAAPAGRILQLPWMCMRGAIDRYHSSGVWAEQHVSVGFVDEPVWHWAVPADGYDFHHRHPWGLPFTPHRIGTSGGLMHLQFVSDKRLRAKQSLYKMLERVRWPNRQSVDATNRQYNLAVYGSETHQVAQRFDIAPAAWWQPYAHLMRWLNPEAEPWQKAECERLWKQYGPETFAGLDLFGVVGS